MIEELKFSLQQTIVISKVERRKQNGILIWWEEYTPVLYVSLSIQPLWYQLSNNAFMLRC